MASGGGSKESKAKLQKSYFEVLGLCCSSEVALIEKILNPVHGIHRISVIVPSRTVIVVHDRRLVSPCEIVKKLNGARLEANVRAYGSGGGGERMRRWPPWQAWLCGVLWAASCFKFLYAPLRWVALAAVVAGISQIAGRSVAALRHRRLDINVLLLIAVMGTIALKDYVEAATVVFLFTIAEWLESMASHKATTVMASLMSIAPQKAIIAATGETMGVEDVKVSTVLAVKAGEAVPIDGVVVEGSCEVDEKTLTGESLPVSKEKGYALWAGTVNLNGYVAMRTTALAEDCVASRMVKLVEEAQNRKSKTQRFIDRCAKYYTPAIVLISAGLAAVPAALKLHDRDRWFHTALVVLVSGCPCSLILSTPVATFSALSKAATAGLLVKGGDYLETLAGIKMAAFDKTGTITRGEFEVTDFQSLTEDVSLGTLIYWVSSIESKSSHPMAAALVDYGRSCSVEPRPENVEDFQSFPGEGIRGKIDGKDIHIGNRRMAMRAGCGAVHGLEAEIRGGSTRGDIYMNGIHIGYFNLSDECRQGVAEAMQELKSLSIRSSMLTGDTHAAAQHVQTQLGNGLDEIHAELLPDDKARIIKEFQKRGPAAMVGDGVNDALALATADVGISMGISGSALAAETGHVVLMSNDIRKLPEAVKLARRCRRKVVENVVLSLLTKGTVLGLACAGRPLVSMAVLADVGTCLLVTFNSSLLLLGGRQGHGHRGKKPCKRSGHSHSFHDLHHHHHAHDLCESTNQKTVTASQPPECASQRPLCCEEGTGLVGRFHRTPCAHPPQCDDGFDGNIHQTCRGDLPRGEEHHSCCTGHVGKTQDFDRTCGEHGPEGAEGRHLQCKLQGQSPGARVCEDMVDDAKLEKMRHNCSMRLDRREMGGCCASYRKECCGKKHWNTAGSDLGGGGASGLSEIVIV